MIHLAPAIRDIVFQDSSRKSSTQNSGKLPLAPLLYRWENDLPPRSGRGSGCGTADAPRHPERIVRDDSECQPDLQDLPHLPKLSMLPQLPKEAKEVQQVQQVQLPPRRPRRCKSPPRNPMNVDIYKVVLSPLELVEVGAEDDMSYCDSSISDPSSSSDASYSSSEESCESESDSDSESEQELAAKAAKAVQVKAVKDQALVKKTSKTHQRNAKMPSRNQPPLSPKRAPPRSPTWSMALQKTLGELVTASKDMLESTTSPNTRPQADVTILFCVRRSGCGNCREHAVQLHNLYQKVPFVNLKGVLKPEPVRKELLREFTSYFPFDLYVDKDWKLFQAMGNRKLSVWKLLTRAPTLESRYAKKNIVNRPFGGDLFTHGGILIFDNKGRVRFVYYEKYGDELDMEALEWAIHEARKPLPGDLLDNPDDDHHHSHHHSATTHGINNVGSNSNYTASPWGSDVPPRNPPRFFKRHYNRSSDGHIHNTRRQSGGDCQIKRPRRSTDDDDSNVNTKKTTASDQAPRQPPSRRNNTSHQEKDTKLVQLGQRLSQLAGSPRIPTRRKFAASV